MKTESIYTLPFSAITLEDVPRVGGKNASNGELYNALKPQGIAVLDGFATTVDAYRRLLAENELESRLRIVLAGIDVGDTASVAAGGQAARTAILETRLPEDLRKDFLAAYSQLCERLDREPEMAVRSSATAEDLPEASFAGQHESYLNVRGKEGLLRAIQACFASLYTDRAIVYRAERGYDHLQVSLSVGVEPMVRSDRGSAGVIFTLDTESGFRDAVVVTGAYGLGEFVVQGVVTPDEWTVFKPTLNQGYDSIIGRRLGAKEVRLVYSDGSRGTRSEPTPMAERARFSLEDADVLTLARWACAIETHYSRLHERPTPMDIEWAKDGVSGELFILQARPETVHSARSRTATADVYRLQGKAGPPLVTGQAVGEKIASGPVRVVKDISGLDSVKAGDILVARTTDPDWEPVMKRVAAIVTDQGGRTAHAAIVSRELGLPCIVGTGTGTTVLQEHDVVTVSCAEGADGHVYSGAVPFEVDHIEAGERHSTRTRIMMNIGDPDTAFTLSMIPNDGVGLARMEFIINNHIGIHPMALVRYPTLRDSADTKEIRRRLGNEQPREFFIRRLSEGIARIAAAFYPNPVIVRTSDFKTNEYASLIGGKEFEPREENPMLGFRGASRYYDARYAEGFALECAALRRARTELGLNNLKVMIPFCRTLTEARRVLAAMEGNGLRRGENGLEVYAMCELPSNVMLAEEFLSVFDGFSIGSNDLTQLVLGIDRDSGTVAHLFDERDDAVRRMIAHVIAVARYVGKPVGICGQAPSDYPDFAAWLVRQGISSISLNPDTVLKTARVIADAEARLAPEFEAVARHRQDVEMRSAMSRLPDV